MKYTDTINPLMWSHISLEALVMSLPHCISIMHFYYFVTEFKLVETKEFEPLVVLLVVVVMVSDVFHL